ncbi:hypothetical protein [Oceaniglobus ichthyenteri]|uniref:hypothetical protein n=1 Tax=Oceaniglobus ichthyenteri TaxID=2136177 RepID=UPI0013DDEBF5|nr:hypothetical protein [Oceaniglobus ichthyenteri]
MPKSTLAQLLTVLILAVGLSGCAAVKLPIKAAGTVVGTTILAVTQDSYRPTAP